MDLKVKNIPLDQIEPSENSRKGHYEVADLMQSIKTDGLLQPVGVLPIGPDKYRLVYGFRRTEAYLKLGYAEIPAVILDKKMSETDVILANAAENITRLNLSPYEEGRVFLALLDKGLTYTEIATRLGVDRHRVERSIGLYETLPERFRKDVANQEGNTAALRKEGRVPASTAWEVMKLAKNSRLSEKNIDALMQASRDGRITFQQLDRTRKLFQKSGGMQDLNEKDLLAIVEEVELLVTQIPVKKGAKERLEAMGGIKKVLIDTLKTHPEWKAILA